jgi:hypothetical protein
MSRTTCLACALAVPLCAAEAQRARYQTSIASGDTVRVWASSPKLSGAVGVVTDLRGDTLALRDLRGRRPLGLGTPVPLPLLARLDVQRGTRPSKVAVVTGSVFGMAAVGVLGALIGVKIDCASRCEGEWEGVEGAVAGLAVGAITGGVGGGLLAGRWNRVPRWRRVGLPLRQALRD